MNVMTMKVCTLFFPGLLFTLLACNGPENTTAITSENLKSISKVDTVKEPGNNIMLVYQDKKNIYWFGSWETGLYRYDGKTILHYTTESGLPGNRIDEIKEDNSGNIFFNTSKGVSKFDGKNFTTLSITDSINEWKLENDDLWFKKNSDYANVYRYDGKALHQLSLPKDSAYMASHPDAKFSPYAVYTIYKDVKGNVWFGTAAEGVLFFDGKKFEWITEDDVTEHHNGPSNGVRSIIEDEGGYFWFNSMYRYKIYGNKNPSAFYSREKSIGSLDGKSDGTLNEYLSIARDNSNWLWIATYKDGVYCYNGKNIIHYTVKAGGKNITVFSIYKDNHGDLWLGTHENGVYKFNGHEFEKFNFD
jgi:ligand-binding sensor domain-containing protein